jgi:hypothetical protein
MTLIAAISCADQRLRQPPQRSACWCPPMVHRRQPCRRRPAGTSGACGISNAVEVRNTHFGRDAEALANKLREALRPVKKRWAFLASAAAWARASGGRWR